MYSLYADGALILALGALAAAVLARSQPLLIAALVLTAAWSAAEIFALDRNPHWLFLLPWTVALLPIYFYRWPLALSVAGWALFAWCVATTLAPHVIERPWIDGEHTALLQLYVFAGIALYIVARGMSWYPRWAEFSPPIISVGAVTAVTALYVLSFSAAHRYEDTQRFSAALPVAWIGATVAALVLVAVLMAWRYHDTQLSSLPLYRKGAFAWLSVGGALALANLLLAGRYPGWIAVGYNLLGLMGVVWLVLTGRDRGERRIVNLGFVFFAALAAARYIDIAGALFDRPVFFVLGGVLLIVAGVLLDRSRRRFIACIGQQGRRAHGRGSRHR